MTEIPGVHRVPSGSAWEEAIGSARAVAAGDRVIVAGMMPSTDGTVPGEDEPYGQTLSAFHSALSALEPFGLGAADVIRTRMYLSHARDVDEVGRAHRELFGAVRPAATMVVVAGFTDSRVLVEVELEAYRGAAAGAVAETGAQAGAVTGAEAGAVTGAQAGAEAAAGATGGATP